MYRVDMQARSLSPTARVILGVLSLGPRSGYEIKKLTDRSTRFFWRASYGQIYPELRRLESAGLVTAAEPEGARRRRAFELTDEGREVLRTWLTADGWADFEYRDEGLLKLFFGDLLSHREVLVNVRRLREQHEAVLQHFRAIGADLDEQRRNDPAVYPYLALDYGIEFMEWVVDWWRDLEREWPTTRTAAPRPRTASLMLSTVAPGATRSSGSAGTPSSRESSSAVSRARSSGLVSSASTWTPSAASRRARSRAWLRPEGVRGRSSSGSPGAASACRTR
jgi:PadR family transcriptional regulator AphA